MLQLFWTPQNIWFTLGTNRVNGPWSRCVWYLFLLLIVCTLGNTSCAISAALASYCIEAKNLCPCLSDISLERQTQRKNPANTVCRLARGMHKRKQRRCNFRYFIIFQFSLNLIVTRQFQNQYFLLSSQISLRSKDFFIIMRITHCSVDLYQGPCGIN